MWRSLREVDKKNAKNNHYLHHHQHHKVVTKEIRPILKEIANLHYFARTNLKKNELLAIKWGTVNKQAFYFTKNLKVQ